MTGQTPAAGGPAPGRTDASDPLPQPAPLREGIFLARPHRFGAYVQVDGQRRYLHVAATGRLRELLYEGNRVLVTELPGANPAARTQGRVLFAWHNGGWVSVDTQLPARLAAAALRAGALPPFRGYTEVKPEFKIGHHRLDFRLTAPGLPPCLIEVKSVTLVEDGIARFPDAPTARGAQHLQVLADAVARGERAAALFLIQRADARAFRPHAENDPVFAAALRAARAAGVEVYAYRCRVQPPRVEIAAEAPVPVEL